MIANPGAEGKDVSQDDVLKALKEHSLGLLGQGTKAVTAMQSLGEAKGRMLRRERERLAERLPADSPRLAMLDHRIQENTVQGVSLAQQAYQMKTPIPAVDSASWTVFGSVRDASGKGLAGLTIAFYTNRGAPIQAFGYACTDKDGYFTVKVPVTQSEQREVYLRVHDGKGTVLHTDAVPMISMPGGLAYREIIIGAKTACTPPWDAGTTPGTRPPRPGGKTDPDELSPQGHGGKKAGTPIWIVRGRVTEKGGAPAVGMIVTIWDKDLFFDDRLGQAETNERGEYELRYTTEDFRDFFERKPDVYVRVTDRSGKRRAQTKDIYRPEAGTVEIIDITLST